MTSIIIINLWNSTFAEQIINREELNKYLEYNTGNLYHRKSQSKDNTNLAYSLSKLREERKKLDRTTNISPYEKYLNRSIDRTQELAEGKRTINIENVRPLYRASPMTEFEKNRTIEYKRVVSPNSSFAR